MTRHTLVALISIALIWSFVGCSKSKQPDGFPPVYPCEITITMNGTPLVGANVSLSSSLESPWFSGGVTDDKGVAKINTYSFVGAPEGEYKVLVSKYELPPPREDSPNGGGGDGPAAKSLLQQKFRSAETTPHSCTVAKGSPNKFEFTVE